MNESNNRFNRKPELEDLNSLNEIESSSISYIKSLEDIQLEIPEIKENMTDFELMMLVFKNSFFILWSKLISAVAHNIIIIFIGKSKHQKLNTFLISNAIQNFVFDGVSFGIAFTSYFINLKHFLKNKKAEIGQTVIRAVIMLICFCALALLICFLCLKAFENLFLNSFKEDFETVKAFMLHNFIGIFMQMVVLVFGFYLYAQNSFFFPALFNSFSCLLLVFGIYFFEIEGNSSSNSSSYQHQQQETTNISCIQKILNFTSFTSIPVMKQLIGSETAKSFLIKNNLIHYLIRGYNNNPYENSTFLFDFYDNYNNNNIKNISSKHNSHLFLNSSSYYLYNNNSITKTNILSFQSENIENISNSNSYYIRLAWIINIISFCQLLMYFLYIYVKKPFPDTISKLTRKTFSGLWKYLKISLDFLSIFFFIFLINGNLDILFYILIPNDNKDITENIGFSLSQSFLNIAKSLCIGFSIVIFKIAANIQRRKFNGFLSKMTKFFFIFSFSLILISIIPIEIFSTNIANLYSFDTSIENSISEKLQIFAFLTIPFHLVVSFQGILIANKKKRIVNIFYIGISFLVYFPLVVIFVFVLGLKIKGLFISSLITQILLAALMFLPVKSLRSFEEIDVEKYSIII